MLTSKCRNAIFVLLLATCATAHAFEFFRIEIVPPSPDEATPVALRFDDIWNCNYKATVKYPAANVIRVDITTPVCVLAPTYIVPPVPIGILAAGTYTIQVVQVNEPGDPPTARLRGQAALVVTPRVAPVPAISEIGLVALSLMLGLFGVVHLRQHFH